MRKRPWHVQSCWDCCVPPVWKVKNWLSWMLLVLGCHRNSGSIRLVTGWNDPLINTGGSIIGVTNVPRELSRNNRNRGYCGRELCYNKKCLENLWIKTGSSKLERSASSWGVGGWICMVRLHMTELAYRMATPRSPRHTWKKRQKYLSKQKPRILSIEYWLLVV